MIQGLWDLQVKSIIEFKLGDTEADSYKYEPMSALLARWEMIKTDNHGKHCHNQRKKFSPFVLSVDGMLGRKYLVVISQLSQIVAAIRGEPLLK